MAKAVSEGLITALDIGSSKVTAMIAQPLDGGELLVLGTGQRESKGVKRGYVADMRAAEAAVRQAVEQAEQVAGVGIEDVWVSFSAGDMDSHIFRREALLDGRRVEQGDVESLLRTARNGIDPGQRMILHAHPMRYSVDGLAGVSDPRGLHADRLGVEVHLVSTEGSPVRNLHLCVGSAHLNVRSIVAAPVATGLACLTPEERDLGVALVEIGAGLTNVSVYAGGVVTGIATLPMGGGDITDDIASTFGTARVHAERLKCVKGSANVSPRDNHEMLEVPPLADDDPSEFNRIARAQLIAVIRTRLDRLIAEIKRELERLEFTNGMGRQVVLTGGGAELKGIADYAQQALGCPVRIGRPRGLTALPDAHGTPAFATLAGLAMFAAADPVDLRAVESATQLVVRPRLGELLRKMVWAFRTNY